MNILVSEHSLKKFESLMVRERADLSVKNMLFMKDYFFMAFFQYYNSNAVSDAVSLLEDFVAQQPNNFVRHQLFRLYCTLIIRYGDNETAHKIALKYSELTNILSDIGTKVYGLPKIVDNTHLVGRIGECVDQTVSTIGMKRLGLLLDKPVIPITKDLKPFIANNAFLPYMADTFELIFDEEQAEFLKNMRDFSPYSTILFKYSDSLWGSHNDTFNSLRKLLIKKQLEPILFELREENRTKALKFLKHYGFKKNDQFIVFHSREGGNVYDGDHSIDRNYVPSTFLDSLKYILDQGLKIIRIGNPKMTPLPELKGLIDLTSVPHPGDVDIFACAEAKFFLGNSSGPATLAYYFDTPTANVGLVPYPIAYSGMLTAFQPLMDKSTRKILTLHEIKKRKVLDTDSPKAFEAQNVAQGRLTPKQILKLTKEMFEFISSGAIIADNKKFDKEKELFGIEKDAYLSRDSLKLLTAA
mgnify:CR=1 FL=1